MVAREIAEHVVRRAFEPGGEEIARVIAVAGGLDVAACEAAGLAHDLGHPPFGHAGEQTLDRLLRHKQRTFDGFEGNAQSFRIVTTLERVKVNRTRDGLDLTNVTLAAILKYPYVRRVPHDARENLKFGAYESEREHLERCRSAVLAGEEDLGQQTLEASVMDLADDIAYAIHDLEDFFATGAIDPRSVERALDIATGGVGDGSDFASSASDDAFTAEAAKLARKYEGYYSDEEYLKGLRAAKSLVTDVPADFDNPLALSRMRTNLSEVVGQLFAALSVSEDPPYTNGPRVYLNPREWHLVQVLKVITRRFLVSRSPMGLLQRAQTQTIEVLFNQVESWLQSTPKEHELPVPLRRVMRLANVANPVSAALSPGHYRAIADFICTLSDSEASLRARNLSGVEVPRPSTVVMK